MLKGAPLGQVWDVAGSYGGPYANPIDAITNKRFKDDFLDLHGQTADAAKETAAGRALIADLLGSLERGEDAEMQRQANIDDELDRVAAMVVNPKRGMVIRNPVAPADLDTVLIYDGHEWVHPIDPFGKRGGPFITRREALASPLYKEFIAKREAAAAAAAGETLADKIFREHIALVKGDQQKAVAEGRPKFDAAITTILTQNPASDIMTNPGELATRARRALKDFLPKAEPAQRAPAKPKDKKGGGRTRRSSRKGRKGTRRH